MLLQSLTIGFDTFDLVDCDCLKKLTVSLETSKKTKITINFCRSDKNAHINSKLKTKKIELPLFQFLFKFEF